MRCELEPKRKSSNSGMTLVEVIVSIALLGIVAAMAMLVLTSSLLLSMRSADNTRQTSSAGTVMNQELIVVTSGSPTQAVVTFNGDGTKTATIDGSFVTTSSSGVLSDAEMKSFVPED